MGWQFCLLRLQSMPIFWCFWLLWWRGPGFRVHRASSAFSGGDCGTGSRSCSWSSCSSQRLSWWWSCPGTWVWTNLGAFPRTRSTSGSPHRSNSSFLPCFFYAKPLCEFFGKGWAWRRGIRGGRSPSYLSGRRWLWGVVFKFWLYSFLLYYQQPQNFPDGSLEVQRPPYLKGGLGAGDGRGCEDKSYLMEKFGEVRSSKIEDYHYFANKVEKSWDSRRSFVLGVSCSWCFDIGNFRSFPSSLIYFIL